MTIAVAVSGGADSLYAVSYTHLAGFNPSDITPNWMEWFMGFPTGWTELTPSVTP